MERINISGLKDKVVVVTGGAGGMGRAMALALLQQGARVVVADNSSTALSAMAEEIQALGAMAQVRLKDIDLALHSSGEALAHFTRSEFGQVFALVNNAGVGGGTVKQDFLKNPYRFWEVTDEQWGRFFSINTDPVFRLMRAFAADMVAAGDGRVVNVTTSLDSMLAAGMAGYGPSKAAAESLSAIAANELAGTGVTVNVLVPGGIVDTGMVPEGFVVKSSMLKPECMVKPLLWLLSDAGKETTGQRFRAHLWNDELPADQNLLEAGAPIAWTSLGGQIRKVQMK